MKTHLLLPLALLVPGAAHSAFYIEPRLAHLNISGTPNVGDVGIETSSDVPDFIPAINLGWEITSRISLEVRHAAIDDIDIKKTAMSGAIFPLPPGHGTIAALTQYEYSQESRIISCALPIDIIDHERFFLTLTPLIQFERSDIRVDRIYGPAESVIANPPPLYDKQDSSEHFGGEINAGYKISKQFGATVSYTYSPLEIFDAHFVSAGFRFSF